MAVRSRDTVQTLNDRLRQHCIGGSIVITSAIQALEADTVASIIAAVAEFEAFTSGNDPFGEHDFGQIAVEDLTVFFKIDAYDRDLRYGSPDPTDPALTRRVMTVMLAEEY